jgi:hypothetical protein
LRHVTFLLRCDNNAQAGAAEMTSPSIELETLTTSERRDLANALLRAAWSATLEEVRVLLLDLLVLIDDSVLEA